MKEVRNGKKMNFKRIYSQIAKYGKTIPELAQEYDMDEQSFIERIDKGIEKKLLSSALKANERNLKQKKKSECSEQPEMSEIATISENHEEDTDMAKRNEERMEQNYRQKQSAIAKETQKQRRQTTRKQSGKSEDVSALENKKVTIIGEISEKEDALKEANQILAIREEAVTETQKVFEEANKALTDAKKERNQAKKAVTQYTQAIDKLKDALGNVESKITDLMNKAIYLVAPGYKGDKPAFGTYYSTSAVDGFEAISVIEATADFAIEPELKDMVVAGYDSYKEYMEGLRFVMLCAEYTCNGTEYTVLVDDERLKRLLQTHVG